MSTIACQVQKIWSLVLKVIIIFTEGGHLGSKRHTVTVCEVEALSPRLRRLRLTAESLRGVAWTPGDKVKLRICGKSRSYTPSAMDGHAGWMDIVFFLHGNGPASRWAAEAEVGTPAVLTRPEKSIKRPKRTPDWVLFLGDETTLGLANALVTSLPPGTPVDGAIEIGPSDVDAIRKLGLPLSACPRGDHYGEALVEWVERHAPRDGRGLVWIAGESVTVRTLKRMLSSGESAEVTVKTKGYWKSKRRRVASTTGPMLVAAK